MTERDPDAVKTLPEQLDELRAELKQEREKRQELERRLDGHDMAFKYMEGDRKWLETTTEKHVAELALLREELGRHATCIHLFGDNFRGISDCIQIQSRTLERLFGGVRAAPEPDNKQRETGPDTIVHSNPPPW